MIMNVEQLTIVYVSKSGAAYEFIRVIIDFLTIALFTAASKFVIINLTGFLAAIDEMK